MAPLLDDEEEVVVAQDDDAAAGLPGGEATTGLGDPEAEAEPEEDESR